MRAAERGAGVDEWTLMRRAGEGAAAWVWRVAAGRAVTVLAGPGNNGGDGYVIAAALRARGLDVAVIAPQPPATETARRAREGWAGPVLPTPDGRRAPVLVDALLGYGLSRPVEGAFAQVLADALARHDYRIAVDVPSGVECDSGRWLGTPWAADLTLALGAWKRAHWLMPASAAMGERRLVDIGLRDLPMGERLSAHPHFTAPAPDAHKYRRGLVAVAAGAMPGAALLAARAAMRAGVGYVKLASEAPLAAAPADLVVAADAMHDPRLAAQLIGPGLGRDDTARIVLASALERAVPAVIDADALHLLDWDMLEGADPARLLLTPHDGELAVLAAAFGIAGEDRVARAQGLRDAIGVSVLAKGPDTLLAPAGGGLIFFPAAPSWLSVAGSGDVLAGIAAARAALHGDVARAAEEAVWLHGAAARIAGPAFCAGDLADAVRAALGGLL